LLYVLWFIIWTVYFGLSEYPELGMIVTVIIALIQILTCLFCYWFVQIRAWMQCTPEKNPWKAELVVVQPTANNGYPEMVQLHHSKNPHDQREHAWFMFQKCRYIYDDSEKKTFQTIDYPLSNSFHTYLQSKGYQTQDEIDQGIWNFGLNKLVRWNFGLILLNLFWFLGWLLIFRNLSIYSSNELRHHFLSFKFSAFYSGV